MTTSAQNDAEATSRSRLQEIINSWSKQKIDTVVGALMDPYFKVNTEQQYCDL